MDRRKYPIRADGYVLYEEVGQGVSASVYRALCCPLNEIVAIKILDFERSNSDLVIPFLVFLFRFATTEIYNKGYEFHAYSICVDFHFVCA